MSDKVVVFVNASSVQIAPGAAVIEALRAFDPVLATAVLNGTAYVTDGRGLEIDPDTPLQSGAILRAGVRARRESAAKSDLAHS
jgi:hypothetical protein